MKGHVWAVGNGFRWVALSYTAVISAVCMLIMLGDVHEASARSGRVSNAGSVRVAGEQGSRISSLHQKLLLNRLRRHMARRRQWLESPKMRAQRLSSRMAFHGLQGAAARKLLIRNYGQLLSSVSANPVASIEREGSILRYLNDHSALVMTTRGLQVETASVPLRVADGAGSKRPVDLGLEGSRGGFAPARPLQPVWIARDSTAGVGVGAEGLRLTLQGTETSGSMLRQQNVFFKSVDPDTDAIVTPKLDGADLSVLLRSQLSPQQLRYQVTLPAGASLQPMAGGAVISRGTTELARIPAPSARDAQGTSVPVQMTVSGDELILTVTHRGRNLSYPVLVDPEVVVNITEDAEAWEFYSETGNIIYCEGHASGSGFGPCEGKNPLFTHSGPGGGNPLTITTPPTSLPFAATVYNESTKEFEEGEVWIGSAEHWWMPSGSENIKAIEFENVTSSGTSGPEEGVNWFLNACRQYHEWNSTEAAQPSVRFEPAGENTCNRNKEVLEPVRLSMTGYTTKQMVKEKEPPYKLKLEGSPVTISGTVSVGAVVVTRPASPAESSEVEGEQFGADNPGEPDRFDCVMADPVNCASGNKIETQTDLSVGGRGPSLKLTRTYNSQLANKQTEPGPFGYGWTGSYSAHLTTEVRCHGTLCNEEVATIRQDNGSTVGFHRFGEGKVWTPTNSLVQANLVKEGTEYLYTLPNQTVLRFSSTGLLASETDRNGNTITINRNAGGRLESVSDPTGRKISLAYNAAGMIESAKDPMGHIVKYTYEAGNLATVTQPNSSSTRWKFKYDAGNEMTIETDGRGNTVTTDYFAHQVDSQIDALKRERTWKYATTKTGTETIISEPNGSTTVEKFNIAGSPTSITRASGTSLAATTTYEYNSVGELVAITDPNNHKTEYGYDSAGNRTSRKDANSNETKWTYNETHDVLSETTPNGEKTTITRDSHGNPEKISRPAPAGKTQTTTFKYTTHGQLESATDPLEHTWKYEYDSAGDQTAEIDPESDKRTWAYNEDSQLTSTVSPRGYIEGAKASEYTTSIERDTLGRPIKVTDPLGHETKYAYDADGNLESVTDPLGHKTKYSYDADNERTKVERPNGNTLETGYDGAGEVKTQTDGNKHTTTYVRNVLEEPIEVIDPLERKTIEEYDPAGNLKSLTDPAKRKTSYVYDAANRLKEVSYSDGVTPTAKFGYDHDGDLTSLTDGSGESTYAYDQLDRLTESKDGHKDLVKYEYNLGNDQTKLTYPNGKSITRTFDPATRLKTVKDWLEHTTTFFYNRDSEVNKITFPTETGNVDEYVFGHSDLMSEVKLKKGTETPASLVYTRNKAGLLESTTAKGLPGAEKETYSYDENNRLLKAGTASYEYDAANNPTTIPGSTNTYDKASQLEKGTGLTYSYDEEGERTKRTPTAGPATTYKYNQAGELTAVERAKEGETPAISESYGYDGTGLLASQTVSGTTSYPAWDLSTSLPLMLSDGLNSYIYGPGGLPIEQISSGGTPTYFHHDQLGSTRMLTSGTGGATGTFSYGAYGGLTGSTGSQTTPLGYAGQYTDAQSGLQYLRARFYDPATAQFITGDPLTEITRAPYLYAGNNPANRHDRTGRASESLEGGCPSPICFPFPTPAEAEGAAGTIGGIPGEIGEFGSEIGSGVSSALNSIFGGSESEDAAQSKESEPCAEPLPPGHNPDTWERRPGSREGSGEHWWDPEGGEWGWHAPDKHHPEGHWNYNPWREWNDEWQNIFP